MTRDAIVQKIRRCNSLPTLPAVAMKVLGVAQSEDADLHELAELIGKDPALSTKVLKTVNSPFYGLTKTVSTISNALVILGTESVKTLVLGFSLVNSLYGGGADSGTQMAYWRRSIYATVACQRLCQLLNILEREELFLASLLEDIGVQVLKQVIPTQYDELLAAQRHWGRGLMRREIAALELSHCEAGLMLAQQWNLPPIICEVIRWHHQPSQAESQLRPNCNIVRLSALCAEVFMGQDERRCIDHVRRFAQAAFQMSSEACDALLTHVGSGTRQMADLFNIDIGQHVSYEDVMAEASETLSNLTLRTQIQARELRVAAETDALTGVANRRKLEETLDSEFARAVRFARPLSVIFLDADRFKSINDNYGHASGDQALMHLARLLGTAARPMDLVGRYGGEEFCLVLPEVGLAAAAALAEKVRALIESSPVALNTGPLKMTVSLGVAGFDGDPGPYKQASQLVQAADRATYAAKSAGRNTVRVFNPRPRKAAPGVAPTP